MRDRRPFHLPEFIDLISLPHITIMKISSVTYLACACALVSTGCRTFNEPVDSDPTLRIGFNGENLDGWAEPHGNWEVVGEAVLDPSDPKKLAYNAGYGVLVNGTDGPTQNLVSEFPHGDVEAHIEFCVPEGSNSGIYFMGRYEVQVLDSWGVEKPQDSDVGGIYHRWIDDKPSEGSAPLVNAAKAPGEWQAFDVVFRAPRFDEHGTKIENARFVSVKLNNTLIQENFETTGYTRAAHLTGPEDISGPLMLQGDHGPVAYRNIRIRDVILD